MAGVDLWDTEQVGQLQADITGIGVMGVNDVWKPALLTQQVQAAVDAGAHCIVFDIPLLVESGRWRSQVDQVLVIDCTPATQVARVVARSALKPEEVLSIIGAQAPRSLRLAAADVVICNEGLSLEVLRDNVVQAARRFGL